MTQCLRTDTNGLEPVLIGSERELRIIDEALADACGAPHDRARYLVPFGRLALAAGDPDKARQMLVEARAIPTRLGAKLLLGRIQRLEAALDDGSTGNLSDGITAR